MPRPQRATLKNNSHDLEIAHRNLVASSAPPPAPIPAYFTDTDSEISHTTSQTATSLHRRDLPMKLQSHWPRYQGKGNSSAFAFFDTFMRRVCPELGEDTVP
ncbi:hypothetical protein BGX23_010292 [Mortierella sp. AD031]|nr:hypothetical protein BGX23_010292 [Mortierella sp. AD031]